MTRPPRRAAIAVAARLPHAASIPGEAVMQRWSIVVVSVAFLVLAYVAALYVAG
ncbi:MAG TPA: hypothetical protein VEH84_18530 [Alphaproteobacteria bacterium]|nr:hypothetical protein [Alphaproteobacteria bacterium]